jgi:hypothetical protein
VIGVLLSTSSVRGTGASGLTVEDLDPLSESAKLVEVADTIAANTNTAIGNAVNGAVNNIVGTSIDTANSPTLYGILAAIKGLNTNLTCTCTCGGSGESSGESVGGSESEPVEESEQTTDEYGGNVPPGDGDEVIVTYDNNKETQAGFTLSGFKAATNNVTFGTNFRNSLIRILFDLTSDLADFTLTDGIGGPFQNVHTIIANTITSLADNAFGIVSGSKYFPVLGYVSLLVATTTGEAPFAGTALKELYAPELTVDDVSVFSRSKYNSNYDTNPLFQKITIKNFVGPDTKTDTFPSTDTIGMFDGQENLIELRLADGQYPPAIFGPNTFRDCYSFKYFNFYTDIDNDSDGTSDVRKGVCRLEAGALQNTRNLDTKVLCLNGIIKGALTGSIVEELHLVPHADDKHYYDPSGSASDETLTYWTDLTANCFEGSNIQRLHLKMDIKLTPSDNSYTALGKLPTLRELYFYGYVYQILVSSAVKTLISTDNSDFEDNGWPKHTTWDTRYVDLHLYYSAKDWDNGQYNTNNGQWRNDGTYPFKSITTDNSSVQNWYNETFSAYVPTALETRAGTT